MATRPPKRPRGLSAAAQQGRLLHRYPGSRVVPRPQGLVWVGELTPSPYSQTYEVLIDHHQQLTPIVYVVRPELELGAARRLEHVYTWNTLCLYLDEREWDRGTAIADTIVPWASEWLHFYELWLASGGDWAGGGVHPSDVMPAREGRRALDRARTAKLERLTSALRSAYGRDADLDVLLYNARLRPPPAEEAA